MAVDDEIEDAEDSSDLVEEEEEQEGGVFRWMSVVVVLLAVAGFFGLAWYAYKSGGEVVDEKDAELIQADSTPVKEAPANPGGMPIPNQDKSVYGLVGGKQEEGKVVEHILASPETPMVHADDQETGTWMSDQVKSKLKTGEDEDKSNVPLAPLAPEGKEAAVEASKTPVPKAEQFNPNKEHIVLTPDAAKPADDTPPIKAAETPKAELADAPVAPVTSEPAKEAAPVETKKPDIKTEKVSAPPPPALEKPAPEKKTQAAPAKPVSSTPPSGSRAQLGAFKSQAEAEGQWKKIAKKFSDSVNSKEHYIVRADLGDKGVFYRLQVAPFDSSKEVDQFCLTLVSDGQGCFPAKGK